MAKKIIPSNPAPDNLELWVAEIAMAFKGAQEFMQVSRSALAESQKLEPWHVAPLMAVGSRGLVDNEKALDQAAGYAFQSFEANYGLDKADQVPPEIAFAFVYVAAHLGLGVIDETHADRIMDVVEANPDTLASMIERAAEMLSQNNPFEFMASGGAGTLTPAPAKSGRGRKAPAKGAGAPPAESAEPAARIYVLEITLAGIKPRIWRRVAVPSDFSLALLNNIIQILFGWKNGHPHEFRMGETRYSPNQDSEDDGDRSLPEKQARLREVAPAKGSKFLYVYDFGDNWTHQITIKKIEPPRPGVSYPVCEAGERAGPPEDCGGIDGYMEILRNFALPKNKRDRDLMDWLDKGFDPEAFDLKAVNAKLKRVGGARK